MTYHRIIRDKVAPETCPLLDEVIAAARGARGWLDEASAALGRLRAAGAIEALGHVSTAATLLCAVTEPAEATRRHNIALRDALAESMKRADELEKERDAYRGQVERSAFAMADAEIEAAGLRHRIAELEALATAS